LHHHRAADRVVGRTGRGMPRVEMSAQHDHFISLVGARDLADRVVRDPSLGIDLIADIKLQLDLPSAFQQAHDAAEVLISHHDGWNILCRIVSVCEGSDLTVLAARVVDPDLTSARKEKRVYLFVDLCEAKRIRSWC